ncbi:MAG: hypothetical protein P8Y05_13805 [Deinococcales bacterium]
MEPKFKLISSNNYELFETRLNDFIQSLDRDTVIRVLGRLTRTRC